MSSLTGQLTVQPCHNKYLPQKLAVCHRGFEPSLGIHKHFVGVEIPGFDFSNQFSGLTMSLLFGDGIHRVIFKKHKKFKIFK
jgi:hypothetical protein